MRLLHKRPSYLLHLLWLGCLALCAATAWLVLQQPWLGLQLAAPDGRVRVLQDVAQQIPRGAELRRLVSPSGAAVDLLAAYLVDSPEVAAGSAVQQYYGKKVELDAMLHSGPLRLVWLASDGQEHSTLIQPRARPLASLSAMFWFTLVVVCSGFMIASWVYLLRPRDWGARMFALTGLMQLVAGLSAAHADAIELAWKYERFGNAINNLATYLFGCALVALFLCYPRQLVQPRRLWWLPALYLPWYLSEQFLLLPSPWMGVPAAAMSFLALAFTGAAVQWRLARRQPLERAALLWFLLAVFVGCSLFTLTYVLPPLLGMPALLPLGYAFGFFLIMYVGIALGLRRYRLFDLDEWAYRVFLWVAGASSVIALDALLIFLTGATQGVALGISLLLCGWLYFPLRQWLWQRIVAKKTPNFESLLPELTAIAFTPSAQQQQTRWNALLQHVFDPLEMKPGAADGGSGIGEDGLRLRVPGCASLPAYDLRYAGHGARLFSTRDAVFAASLGHLLEQVMSGRSSYERGVTQERLRIGRDLHDNIGARLLKLIHHLRGTPNAEVARDAMKDLRTAIAAMDSRPVPLRNALADWRAETGARCDAANCRLHWQQSEELPEIELAPRVKASLESVMREIVTNALKHAAPSQIRIEVSTDATRLRASIANDGTMADPLTWSEGYGLRNLRGRLEELGGSLRIAGDQKEVRIAIEVALT